MSDCLHRSERQVYTTLDFNVWINDSSSGHLEKLILAQNSTTETIEISLQILDSRAYFSTLRLRSALSPSGVEDSISWNESRCPTVLDR